MKRLRVHVFYFVCTSHGVPINTAGSSCAEICSFNIHLVVTHINERKIEKNIFNVELKENKEDVSSTYVYNVYYVCTYNKDCVLWCCR